MNKAFLILFAALILPASQAFPQGKFELSSGLGFPEAIDLKVKYGQH